MGGNRPGEPIRWRLHLRAPPERVYEALDSDAGRAGFWAETAPELDGAVDFLFVEGTRYRARILERRPGELFALDYFGGEARFELTSDGQGGTDLLLIHRDVAPDEWHEVHAGWLNVLLPLKAWVDHGVDLRNHDPARGWSAGYVDQ